MNHCECWDNQDLCCWCGHDDENDCDGHVGWCIRATLPVGAALGITDT